MSPTAKRTICLTAVGILGILALAAWRLGPWRRTDVRLSPISNEAVPRSVLAAEPIYRQADPRWADQTLGGSGEPLRSVGCTVCCISMALAHHGITLDPSELNRKLKEADAYTERGWVKWKAVTRVTGNRVRIELPRNPSNRDIEAALAEGNPVLVKIILSSGAPHWVLLVGRDGHEYLMKDPLGDGKTLKPLSSFGSEIRSVRIVTRA